MHLIYDLEIIRCIPPREGALDPSLEYCEGWDDHANMGISIAGWTFLGGDAVYADFSDPNQVAFFRRELAKAETTIGFNSSNSDDLLLRAHGINVTTDYDLLSEVRIAAGFSANYESVPRGYSYSLDAIAKANGGAKTGSGALAPQLWQQGKKQAVIDYCLNDVRLTERLLKLGLQGQLIDPNTGDRLQLRELD